MKIFLTFFIFLAACGANLDDKRVENPETKRQKDRLEALGNTIKGTYKGVMEHVDGHDYEIEIRLYSISEVSQGRNENGELETMPRLQGQIRYNNFVYSWDESPFDVTFTERGNFEMILAVKGQQSSGEVLVHIQGHWTEGRIKAVWMEKGLVGNINAERVSKDVPVIEERERRERNRQQYMPVANTYQSSLKKLNEGIIYDCIETTITYSELDGGIYAIVKFSTKPTFNNLFNNVPVNWDPRTKAFNFTINIPNSNNNLVATGYLSEKTGLEYSYLRLASAQFIATKEKSNVCIGEPL